MKSKAILARRRYLLLVGALILIMAFNLCGCFPNQFPRDVLEDAIKGPANAGVTIKSDYVQEPTYMHDPVEWSVEELNIKDQEIKDDTAEIVSESRIKNESFEIEQTLKQKFVKKDNKWTLDETQRIDSSAKALTGINYVPSASGFEMICLADLPDAKVDFNEDEQTCVSTYSAGSDESNWLVSRSGVVTLLSSFDGMQWNLDSESFEGEYHSAIQGKSISGSRAKNSDSAIENWLGSSKASDSYTATFNSITESQIVLTLDWSGERSQAQSSMDLIYNREPNKTAFNYSAQYSGRYKLGNSLYGFGEEESFTLVKNSGDSSMPNEIACVFTYPDRNVTTRVLTISWEDDDGGHQIEFILSS